MEYITVTASRPSFQGTFQLGGDIYISNPNSSSAGLNISGVHGYVNQLAGQIIEDAINQAQVAPTEPANVPPRLEEVRVTEVAPSNTQAANESSYFSTSLNHLTWMRLSNFWAGITYSQEVGNNSELTEQVWQEIEAAYKEEQDEAHPIRPGYTEAFPYEDPYMPAGEPLPGRPVTPIEIVNPIEEITITAPRLPRPDIPGIEVPIWITPTPGISVPRVPIQPIFPPEFTPNTPIEIQPGIIQTPWRPSIATPERPDEPVTRPDEVIYPWNNPNFNPRRTTLPGLDNIPPTVVTIQPGRRPDGKPSWEVTIKPQNNPHPQREENKRRKDKKSAKSRQSYRRVLRFVNSTFGRATELLDLASALQDNIYVPKGTTFLDKNGNIRETQKELPMSAFSLDMQKQFLEKLLNGTVEMTDVRIDAAGTMNQWSVNNSMDKAIGKVSQKYAEALNDMGIVSGIRANPISFY